MGGEIAVESEEGRGTTFTFSAKSRVNHESIRQYVYLNTAGNEGKRALVVDDNNTNLAILKNLLHQWKLHPTLATSGNEALKLLPEGFDIVITDMQMPGMDGVTLSTEIKQKYPGLPLILLSSIGDDSRKKHSELFSAVLNKPVKPQQLCKVVHSVLKSVSIPVAAFPLNILVVEDNQINQKLTVRALNKLGYENVVVAENGAEALEHIADTSFDLVFMDIQMPIMDGLEATRMIRSKPWKQPFIISMTANALEEDREQCFAAGMDEYIAKPIRLEDLVAALEKAGTEIKKNRTSR
jgi:CheY-like chemotaxis protein